MVTHKNAFVENPVFESKQCFIFQLNLLDKKTHDVETETKTALEKHDKRTKSVQLYSWFKNN